MATFIDNSSYVLASFKRQMGQAKEEVKTEILDNILWQMFYGYSEPHGEDGHTEIYDTGALYQSIEVNDGGNIFASGPSATVGSYNWVVEASANTEYASYVHQGTYKLHGRPFITDGFNRATPNVKAIIAKHMKG